ncbi:Flavocytochrome C [Mycena chlorophos]|uniref:Fumarate reductase n=1 Tax=Mycena chlorophos TaxID=658473 RepID=A0A8H6TMM1_MYCCL|nr:Flavocytochrome C [Mycena chlorophos]
MTTSSTPSALPTIVVGGGLAGLTAAHTLLERGKRVVLLDKSPGLGGNSVKASSGINGAGTETQKALGVEDSVKAFAADTTKSAVPHENPALISVLTANSASAISWLADPNTFGIDLSLLSRLGGHSAARTHRDKGGAPGWAITSALMKKLVAISEEEGERGEKRVAIVKNARVVRLCAADDGTRISGVEYEVGTELKTIEGEGVVLATGGYGADFSETSYLAAHRPDLLSLSTTNGAHATGDGIRLATAQSLPANLRAGTTDLSLVQVHPTGFVDPANPDAKTKFLAAEALRGAGGMLLDKDGKRFVKEVERRDVVTAAMQTVQKEGRGPVRLVLGEKAVREVAKHCAFYVSKGLMQRYDNALDFSADVGIPLATLLTTLASFGGADDAFGPGPGAPYAPNEALHVAIITPVVHYTMGGLSISPSAQILTPSGDPIPGLFAAGEVVGGVHGGNRLAGSSLLEAVVFGRIAGAGVGA